MCHAGALDTGRTTGATAVRTAPTACTYPPRPVDVDGGRPGSPLPQARPEFLHTDAGSFMALSAASRGQQRLAKFLTVPALLPRACGEPCSPCVEIEVKWEPGSCFNVCGIYTASHKAVYYTSSGPPAAARPDGCVTLGPPASARSASAEIHSWHHGDCLLPIPSLGGCGGADRSRRLSLCCMR